MSFPLIINGVCYGTVTPKEEHYCDLSIPEEVMIKVRKDFFEEAEQNKTKQANNAPDTENRNVFGIFL